MGALAIYYTAVGGRAQTAHGLVEEENAKQGISILASVGLKGGILISALVSN